MTPKMRTTAEISIITFKGLSSRTFKTHAQTPAATPRGDPTPRNALFLFLFFYIVFSFYWCHFFLIQFASFIAMTVSRLLLGGVPDVRYL